MLIPISILTCLIFCTLYPLNFWLVQGHPIDAGFRKFNLGLVNVVGGLTLVAILLLPFPIEIKIITALWKASLLSVSSYSWKKERVNPLLLSAASMGGIIATMAFTNLFVPV